MHKYGLVHIRMHGHALGHAYKISIHTRVHDRALWCAYKIYVHALMHTLVHGHVLGCVLMKNLHLSFRTTELEDFRIERLQKENIIELKILGQERNIKGRDAKPKRGKIHLII